MKASWSLSLARTRCAVIAISPAPSDQMCRWWAADTPGCCSNHSRTCCWSMPRGTASIAALKASRSRPKDPAATTTATSSAVAGSSQLQPSHHTPAPASTAASETAASASRCRKAPRRLRSCSWPPRTSQAAPRLMAMPIAATTITGRPGICGGALKRRIASQPSAPEKATSSSALASGESRVARRQP